MHVKILMSVGNIEPIEADALVQHIEDVLFKAPQPMCKPLLPSQHLTNRIVRLDKGVMYYYPVGGLNQNDENSAVVHYIQVLLLCIVWNTRDLKLLHVYCYMTYFHS